MGVAAVLAATLVVGATVQGLVGLGLGLVAAPVTTLLAPDLMPGLLLWLALFLPVVTLVRDHHDIDWRGLGWSMSARLPGTVVGVVLVGMFSAQAMGVAVGLMVLASVLVTAWSVRLPVNRVSLTTAGFVSGVAGTTTSIGGPPMAILLQHRAALQVRSTLAVYFVGGAGVSLLGLGLTGAVDRSTFLLAVALAPALLVGVVLSRVLHRVVPARHFRPAVLWVCGLSSVVLLAKSLFLPA